MSRVTLSKLNRRFQKAGVTSISGIIKRDKTLPATQNKLVQFGTYKNMPMMTTVSPGQIINPEKAAKRWLKQYKKTYKD